MNKEENEKQKYIIKSCIRCNGSGSIISFYSTRYWEYCGDCEGTGIIKKEYTKFTRFEIMEI